MSDQIVDYTKMRPRERIDYLEKRDGLFCTLPECKTPSVFSKENFPTVDHTHPISRGGIDHPDNWSIMHVKCNNKKSNRLLLPDGTLEVLPGKQRPAKVKKKIPCDTCMEGRLLLENEECPDCGIGPQPVTYPRYKQRSPKECDHSKYHCAFCIMGIYERKEVIQILISG